MYGLQKEESVERSGGGKKFFSDRGISRLFCWEASRGGGDGPTGREGGPMCMVLPIGSCRNVKQNERKILERFLDEGGEVTRLGRENTASACGSPPRVFSGKTPGQRLQRNEHIDFVMSWIDEEL